MLRDSMHSSGVAFDNYDRFVETFSGKDTLHDTVGIAYQTIDDIVQSNTTNHSEGSTTGKLDEIIDFQSSWDQPISQPNEDKQRKKRRRIFDAGNLEIEPYRKKN